jgi:hypothetical protein
VLRRLQLKLKVLRKCRVQRERDAGGRHAELSTNDRAGSFYQLGGAFLSVERGVFVGHFSGAIVSLTRARSPRRHTRKRVPRSLATTCAAW